MTTPAARKCRQYQSLAQVQRSCLHHLPPTLTDQHRLSTKFTSPPPSSLFNLPPELRIRIWDLALPSSPDEDLFPALLQTCRVIRDEGAMLFYGRRRYERSTKMEEKEVDDHVGDIEVQVSFPHGLVGIEGDEAVGNGQIGDVDMKAADMREMQDNRAWYEKLNVTAVECCEEGVVLSAPPFPFRQRWDREYEQLRRWRKMEERRSKKNEKGRRGGGWNGGFDVE